MPSKYNLKDKIKIQEIQIKYLEANYRRRNKITRSKYKNVRNFKNKLVKWLKVIFYSSDVLIISSLFKYKINFYIINFICIKYLSDV